MSIRRVVGSMVLFLGLCPGHAFSDTRTITFEERVEAQRIIERFYHSHHDEVSRSYEASVPIGSVRDQVTDYLKRSVALERYWGRPITAEVLAREARRIASSSKMPGRLVNLWAALGNDPVLIQETVVRRALVNRLTYNLFRYDQRIHAARRDEAVAFGQDLVARAVDPATQIARRETRSWCDSNSPRADACERLSRDAFVERRRVLPRSVGAIGELRETETGFVFEALLAEAPDYLEAAFYTVPKLTWDVWWGGASRDMNIQDALTVASTEVEVLRQGTCSPELDDFWDNGLLGVPSETISAQAIWTGSEMIVWGGTTPRSAERLSSGSRYDPLTDSWTPISLADAPDPRDYHAVIWTGTEMIVWGGRVESATPTKGARYDPATDSWTALSDQSAPDAFGGQTAVWTGTEMIVWGGLPSADGARYDPATDSWTPMAASPLQGRLSHTAIWTGTEMIVWGGADTATQNANGPVGGQFGDGARYDPVSDQWTALPSPGAPGPRALHSAMWTGTEMIVYGGDDGPNVLGDGARYDPVQDTWTPMAASVDTRARHAVAWTGSEMLVWDAQPHRFEVQRYDPVTDQWSTTLSPTFFDDWSFLNHVGTVRSTAVWTGTEWLVWAQGLVGRYDPSTHSASPASTGWLGAGRTGSATVWTGNELIVWGGMSDDGPLDDGTRYDPMLDSFSPTTSIGVPVAQSALAAQWTGSEMIVWGQAGAGARYDPLTNAWSPMSTAPVGTTTTTIWTGSEMLMWNPTDGGARYHAASDVWTPMSSTNAPASGAKRIWTGSEMIVYHGAAVSGARYDPTTDSWTPMATLSPDVPCDENYQFWTGTELIAICWPVGDLTNRVIMRYSPATDSWEGTGITYVGQYAAYAADPRRGATTAWTGSELIAWSGEFFTSNGWFTRDGSRYRPSDGSFTAMSPVNAPYPRRDASTVWTGSSLIVVTGEGNQLGEGRPRLRSGGQYFSAQDVNNDGIQECLCVPAVSGLTATPNGDNRIDLAWNDSADAAVTAYAIERVRPPFGQYERVAVIADTSPGMAGGASYAYSDTTASGGETYDYVVYALQGTTCSSEASPAAQAVTTGDCLLAPFFAGLGTVTAASSSICSFDLTWPAAESRCGGSVTYDVHRMDSNFPGCCYPTGPPEFVPDETNRLATGLTSTSYLDTERMDSSPGQYMYHVRAVDTISGLSDGNPKFVHAATQSCTQVGSSCPDNPIVDVTPDSPPPVCPGAPVTLTAGLTGGTGPYSYQWTQFGVPIVGATGPTFEPDVSFPYSSYYNVHVKADSCPNDVYDNFNATVPTNHPLFGGLASATDLGLSTCAIRLDWQPGATAACAGPVSYTVFRDTVDPVAPSPANVLATGLTVTKLDDFNNVVANQPYSYLVRAFDQSTGLYDQNVVTRVESATGPCTTFSSGPPPVPGNTLRATRSGGSPSFDVSWDAAACPAADYNLLYGDLGSVASHTLLGAECSVGTTGTYTWSTPPAGTLFYLVVGTDGAGTESSWGRDSAFAERGAGASGFCAITAKVASNVCP